MKHTAIYSWRITAGREQEFQDAWAMGTQLIKATCGSGGAELFTGPDNVFYSLARWPSQEARAACFEKLEWAEQPWLVTLKNCIAEGLPEVALESLRDLRKPDGTYHSVPTLHTKRLTLRALGLEDSEQLFSALGDEACMRYWSRGPLENVEAAREYMKWNVEGAGVQCFAITETTKIDKALGWVALIDQQGKQVELGFILRPDAWGQGIATEAVSRAIQHAFETRGIRRIHADIDPDNAASIALIKKLGFAYEGLLRGTWETHLGVRDSAIYSRLASD